MSFLPVPSMSAATAEDIGNIQENNRGKALAQVGASSLSSSIEALNGLDEEDTRMVHSRNADWLKFFIDDTPNIFNSPANTGITVVDSFVHTAGNDALNNVLQEQLVDGGAGGINGAEKVEQCQQMHGQDECHHQPEGEQQREGGEQMLEANNVALPQNNANANNGDESFAQQPSNNKNKLLSMAILALLLAIIVGILFYVRATENANIEENVKKLRTELNKIMAENGRLELKLMEADKFRLENGKKILAETREIKLKLVEADKIRSGNSETENELRRELDKIMAEKRKLELKLVEMDKIRNEDKGETKNEGRLPNWSTILLFFFFIVIIRIVQKNVRLNNKIQRLTLQKQALQPLELDKMKNSGQILFRIANFKAFSEGRGPAEGVFSEPVEHINGLPWRFDIEYKKERISIFLNCNGDKNDMAWHCRASYKLSVISSTKNDICLNSTEDRVFSASNRWGWGNFAKIEELMDPKNGFYDAEGDTITLKAEVIVKELKGMARIYIEHSLLVNGKVVHVNKYLLAAHSKFFQNLFFGANAHATPKVQVEDDENAVAHFERMVSTMCPINSALDDNCVAYVLCLAHKFQLDSVVNLCVDFLLTSSKKSAIVKFGLAHQCDIVGMKEKLLAGMTKDDFAVGGENFMDNFLEYNKLGAEAMQELRKRHTELLGTSN